MNFDVNTADASFQARYPDCPNVEQPLLAATWEVNTYDAVDTLMELKPDTAVLYQPFPDQPGRPLFFHVSAPLLKYAVLFLFVCFLSGYSILFFFLQCPHTAPSVPCPQTLCTELICMKLVMSRELTFEIHSVCVSSRARARARAHARTHARTHAHTHTHGGKPCFRSGG